MRKDQRQSVLLLCVAFVLLTVSLLLVYRPDLVSDRLDVMRAHSEGYWAGMNGLDYSDNPYDYRHPERMQEWYYGWQAAKMDGQAD